MEENCFWAYFGVELTNFVIRALHSQPGHSLQPQAASGDVLKLKKKVNCNVTAAWRCTDHSEGSSEGRRRCRCPAK